MTTIRKRLVVAGITAGTAGLLVLGTGGAMAATGANPWGTWGPCGGTGISADGTSVGPMGGGPAYMGGDEGGTSAAADYLGLTEEELRAEFRAGKSLADIAAEQGKSLTGLEDAMLAEMKEHLDENTNLTDAQRDYMLDQMDDRVADMINGDRGGYGSRGGMMGGGFGGRWS